MGERLSRKFRDHDELAIKSSGGMLDLFDNAIKQMFRIDDKEFDFICEFANDSQLDILLKDNNSVGVLTKTEPVPLTFAERRAIINVLNELLLKCREAK